MSSDSAAPSPKYGFGPRPVAVSVALLAACFYILNMDGLGRLSPTVRLGDLSYNYLFLSILEGKLSIPMRVIAQEGHYSLDGEAYIYVGLGPLLYRLLAWPFVDLRETGLGGLSVGISTIVGSCLFQMVAYRHWVTENAGRLPRTSLACISLLLSLLVWLVGPGIILSSLSMYAHEPTAFAYALSGLFLFLLLRERRGDAGPAGHAIVALSMVAALVVHARPHVAVGMYAALVAIMLEQLRAKTFYAGTFKWELLWPLLCSRLFKRMLAASLILGLSSAGFLALNEARFGSAWTSHAGAKGESIYGYVFLGLEPANSARMRGFEEKGRFNLRRIPSNTLLHLEPRLFESWAENIRERLEAGFVRTQGPYFGIIALWTPWLLLAAFALCRSNGRRPRGSPFSFALIATGFTSLFILSYATVSYRYKVEIWPLLFSLALLGGNRLLETPPKRLRASLPLALSAGVTITLIFAVLNSYVNINYATIYDDSKPYLSLQECEEALERIAFPKEKIAGVCAL